MAPPKPKRAGRTQARKEELARAVHALEVHKIELELQNRELELARQGLEAALERYTEVFDFAPIGYVTLDRTGKIREVNHVLARLLGLERRRLVERVFADLVVPSHREMLSVLIDNALASTGPAACDLDLFHEGRVVPVRMTAAFIRRGTPTILIACEDISDRRASESELAHTAMALREANRRKDDFIAMLSHELRNPLSPIRTSIGVLRLAAPGSEHARAAIDIIDRAAAHPSRLVDELLDVSRARYGKIQLRRAPVELGSLLRRVVDDHRGGIAAARLRLVESLDTQELWVDGDEARLVQIFSNLLNNAEKFTAAGGTISISLDHDRDHAVVAVRDSGVGITTDLIAELFEPFAQAPQALDRRRGGLGLGLALVKQLVELHEGTVEIRSAGLGKGTTVVVRIPAVAAREAIAVAKKAVRGQPRRILIVEDHTDTAESLRRALVLQDHDVDVAGTAHEALAKLAASRPHVVFCDLGLPDMDGYALAMRIRASEPLRGPYLVALSGYAREEDVARAKQAGFHRHLAKPARLEEIEEILATLPDSAGTLDADLVTS
jgi:two-component system CheB/CheR fusion protein